MLQQTDIYKIMAQILSVVFYPLFTSTYVMILFCHIFSHTVLPLPVNYQLLAIGGTLLLTCLLPLGILGMLIKRGRVKNLDVTDRKERTIPYLYAMGCIGCWCYFLHLIRMPQYVIWSAVASFAVLIIVMLITLRWKISVHLSSMGGAVAMITGIMMHCGIYRPSLIVLLLGLSWLLMIARIKLEAHTPAQTVAGFLLGLIIVLIPNIILAYAF